MKPDYEALSAELTDLPPGCGFHYEVMMDLADGSVWVRMVASENWTRWQTDDVVCVLKTTKHVAASTIQKCVEAFTKGSYDEKLAAVGYLRFV